MGRAYQHGLGDAAEIGHDISISASGIATLAPAAGPAAPIVLAVAALVSLSGSIIGLFNGCGQSCDHDTIIVEKFEAACHVLWYALTGEVLPGIPGLSATTIPGQYGAQGINLFQNSAYPNVPWPLGNAPGAPSISQAIAALNATYQDANSQLVRQQSVPNLANNYHYFLNLLQNVSTAQAQAAATSDTTSLLGTSGTLGGSIGNWWSTLPSWGQPAVVVAGVVLIVGVTR